MQDNEDKETSRNEVQSTTERKDKRSRWGRGGVRDFPHPSRPGLRPTQPPIQWVQEKLPKFTRPRRGVDHLSTLSAEVKERVELSVSSWHIL